VSQEGGAVSASLLTSDAAIFSKSCNHARRGSQELMTPLTGAGGGDLFVHAIGMLAGRVAMRSSALPWQQLIGRQ